MKKTRKLLLLLAVVCTLLVCCMMSASAETEGYYTYTVTDGEATITDVDTAIGAEVVIPDTLGGVPVTTIYGNAFNDCRESITSITIPNSVTTISDDAFFYCTSLTSITIPDSVTSIGASAFYHCSSLTSITIPNSVTTISTRAFEWCESLESITIPDGVTIIGDEAFCGCTGLTSITIPDSVTSIGEGAFLGCSGLTGSLTIPDGVTSIGRGAFRECPNLESITIPDGVTSIGEEAFMGCSSLKNLSIPVAFIYVRAFGGCVNLEDITVTSPTKQAMLDLTSTHRNTPWYNSESDNIKVTLPDNITSIGARAFYECTGLTSITIPDGVTTIGDSAFFLCSGLTGNITIPDGVTSIGEYAFCGCTGLTGSITIPNGVTSISYYTFEDCTGLENVTIPESVTSIGVRAFMNCTSLESITIPDSVTSIGGWAFYGCTGLKNLSIPVALIDAGDSFSDCVNLEYITVTSPTKQAMLDFDSSTYKNTLWYKSGSENIKVTLSDNITSIGDWVFYYCTGLTSITIPDSLTSIGDSAFCGCKGLTGSITIPDGATSIGDRAFYGCSGLTSITIPDGVTSIGDYAFSGCSGLTSITIPDGVTSIGVETFYNCTSLTSITIPDGVTSIGDNAFSNCTGLISITIPDSVTSIGYQAFYKCTGLTGSITIPDGVTTIGANAFYKCTGLTSITIPASVTSIGYFIVDTSFLVHYIGTGDDWNEVSEYDTNCYNLHFIPTGNTFSCKTPAFNTSKTCEICAEWINNVEIIHSFTNYISDNNVTCTADGTKTAVCANGCGEEDTVADVDSKTGHSFGEWTYDWDNLVRTSKCLNCDEVKSEALEKAEDTENEIEILAPADPDTTFTVENVADEADERYVLVVETLESYEGDAAVETVYDITLENSEGVSVQPDGTVQVKLPVAEAHSNYKVFRINDDGTYTDMNATVVDGYVVFETDHFSLYVIVDTSEKHEHEYNGVVTTPATHTKEGVMTYTCSCGDSYTEAIEKDPQHHWELKYFAPTCTEDGYDLAVCACGDEFVYKTYVALNHKYDYKLNYAATHLKDGLETYTCSRCGYSYTNTLPRKTEHYYSYYTKTTEPTCTEQGYTLHECECGDSYKDNYKAALGHQRSPHGDWCDRCGATMAPAKPDTSKCSCNCHKTGFMGFIYKLQRFFWKLFKTNKTCACGTVHY